MQVIPAIDLRGGLCVRLRQGDFDHETVFGDDPAAMAARWESEGAARIHLVDLDGAKAGRPVNVEAVGRIVRRVHVPCQLGGGMRDQATIAAWLEAGLDRVIVGTQALRDPDWFGRMAETYPGRLVLGLDARDGTVATQGWLETSTVEALALAEQFDELPLAGIIYTDIARDGTLEGPNLDATARPGRAVQDAGDRLGRRRLAWPTSSAWPRLPHRRLHRRSCSLRRAILAGRGHRASRGRGRKDWTAARDRPHVSAHRIDLSSGATESIDLVAINNLRTGEKIP